MSNSFKGPKPHPVVPMVDEALLASMLAAGEEKEAAELLAQRERVIMQMEHDPLNHGYEPEIWGIIRWALDNYGEVLVLGGNRGGKSEIGGKLTNEFLRDRDAANVAALHNSAASSIAQQQDRVFRYLPPELRSVGKGDKHDKVTNIQYTKANGFTHGKFITPDSDTCMFFNYMQEARILEGYELDFAWCDELVTKNFIEALRFRLLDRHGKLFITFTPVDGYTQVVASFVAGAQVVKSQRAPLLDPDRVHVKGCPKGHMPRLLINKDETAAIVCIWNTDNPFTSHEEMRNKLKGKKDVEIKIRAYGWATKLVQGALPNFNEAAHVITRERWKEIEKAGGTRYVACDPAGAKPWVIKWYFVTPDDEVIVYREWPTVQEFGWWAKATDKPKFDYDEGCFLAPKLSISGYKKLIWELSGAVWDAAAKRWDFSNAEEILMFFIDPRFGGKVAPSAEEQTSIIDLMADDEDGSDGIHYPPMYWERAPASIVESSVQMINNRMYYDDEKPLAADNCPTWYVVEDCKNSILAYNEYAIEGGDKCALKDFIDADRYYATTKCGYITNESLMPTGGGYS